MAATDAQKDLTETVAKHYNELQEAGLEERTQSRIFYQRNFNNWIKSMAIADILTKLRQQVGRRAPISVLDLACGKGGDMLKWKKGEISHLVCADIAALSLQQCESRFKEMIERTKQERHSNELFTAEFITADCTKQSLKELYKDPNTKFDIVSCQFAFHYCFESLAQAEVMLKNACECLKPGGYFIGTTPDSYELVKRLRSAEDMSFGNEVYRITFETPDKENLPLFGAKYDFHLEGVVSCPEFLVYFPLLEKMAEKYKMKLLYRIPFADFFKQHVATHNGRGLIGRMSALEPYPAEPDVALMSKDEASYAFAKQYIEQLSQNNSSNDGYGRRPSKVGTLSLPEWEASTLYVAFAFQRCDDTLGPTPSVPESSSLKRKHEEEVSAADKPSVKECA